MSISARSGSTAGVLREITRRVDWVQVGGRWTRISVMGTDLSPTAMARENRGDDDNRIVMLMIPGNPGNEGFYSDFGRRVLRALLAREERLGDRKMHYMFFTVSHLNHVKLPAELKHAGPLKFNDRFQLDAQVQHKLDFIREYLPRGQKVYLFGHSIGSYMMLKVLPYVVDDFNIRKAVGLFPTIERMAVSPNGMRLRRVLSSLDSNDWLAKSLSFWLDALPMSWKKWLVGFNLSGDGVPKEVVESASELLNMHVFRNIIHMSNDEMEKVVDLDETLIALKPIIHFYYGLTDGWVPKEYGYEMEQRFPKGQVVMDDDNCEHAFVIRDGTKMAEKLLMFIS